MFCFQCDDVLLYEILYIAIGIYRPKFGYLYVNLHINMLTSFKVGPLIIINNSVVYLLMV
jgi:hypothetical protein